VRIGQMGAFAATTLTLACTNNGISGNRASLIAPPCADPAPITNSHDPTVQGYIVSFRDGTDAAVESARLAEVHGFSLRHVFASPSLRGFSADMSPSSLAAVRCEERVESVEFILSISVNQGRAT
jgi:hypothetical protein